jgi:hypothetical protein
MSDLSSSDHTLNADHPLSKWNRIRWLYLNWRNNSRPREERDPQLVERVFAADRHLAGWDRIAPNVSPARRLCDLFWMSMPWPRLARAVGGPLRLLEVGCGSGRYGTLLRDCAGADFASYAGIDVVADAAWPELARDLRFSFALAGSADAQRHLGDANLVFTQSAIEHFDEDLAFMRMLAAHVRADSKPLLQVHLMPSAGGLRTFMWHGVRNYTPRTISRLTAPFGGETHRVLHALGSGRCNRLHRHRITYPWLLGRPDGRQTGGYDEQLRAAITDDARQPRDGEVCFYALVLASNLPADILDSW